MPFYNSLVERWMRINNSENNDGKLRAKGEQVPLAIIPNWWLIHYFIYFFFTWILMVWCFRMYFSVFVSSADFPFISIFRWLCVICFVMLRLQFKYFNWFVVWMKCVSMYIFVFIKNILLHLPLHWCHFYVVSSFYKKHYPVVQRMHQRSLALGTEDRRESTRPKDKQYTRLQHQVTQNRPQG